MEDIKCIFTQVAAVLGIVGIFIEITPIPINPISIILGWIGKQINSEMKNDMRNLEEKITKLARRVDEKEIDDLRWEILDFSNSCMNGRLHTKGEFDHIVSQNQKYHRILEENGMKNGQVEIEYKNIERIYQKCIERNNFL